MNLYSVSWEVIHMTSRTTRDLVPNLSGDSRCISSSARFTFPASPMGHRSSETGPFQVHDHGQGHNCIYVCVCVCAFVGGTCFFLRMATPQRQKKDKEMLNPPSSLRSHPSAPDLTLEDGCSPAVHPVTEVDGAEAPWLSADWLLIRRTVRLAGKRFRGRRSFFFVYNRPQSL